jgi:hypothetical protein
MQSYQKTRQLSSLYFINSSVDYSESVTIKPRIPRLNCFEDKAEMLLLVLGKWL